MEPARGSPGFLLGLVQLVGTTRTGSPPELLRHIAACMGRYSVAGGLLRARQACSDPRPGSCGASSIYRLAAYRVGSRVPPAGALGEVATTGTSSEILLSNNHLVLTSNALQILDLSETGGSRVLTSKNL